jgi:hypothetical protein
MLGLVATMTGSGSIKCSVIAVAENTAAQQLYTTTGTDCTSAPDKQAIVQLWEYSDYGWEGGANC